MPSYGSLPADGRKPYSPLKAAGIRILLVFQGQR
jgi:hypothetical protein